MRKLFIILALFFNLSAKADGRADLSSCNLKVSSLQFTNFTSLNNLPEIEYAEYPLTYGRYLGAGANKRGCRITITGSRAKKISILSGSTWKLMKIHGFNLFFRHPTKPEIMASLYCNTASSNKYIVTEEDILTHLQANGILLYCDRLTESGNEM